ncbi:hypothetical protein [Fluviicola chungangensis]|uniref:Lipoprotein n=1 Tax=Fluviicola chungangensis TaxID=2597671 RepID=A0A556N7Q8_9FLAO|nr:hypothetical protein [Fluviicola chungangensis]TSJ48195.1 hypothetical protein FO442_03390 [Fluviicola chungangensis]
MTKIILFIFVLGFVTSCHPPKEMTDPDKETHHTTGETNDTYYLGEVQMLDCGIVIGVLSGESKRKFSPVNLDPKFQVDKLRLKLKFKVLDEKATTCSEFQVIEIKEAFAVR